VTGNLTVKKEHETHAPAPLLQWPIMRGIDFYSADFVRLYTPAIPFRTTSLYAPSGASFSLSIAIS